MTKLIHLIPIFQFILFTSILEYPFWAWAEPNHPKWAQTISHNIYEQKTTLQFYFHDSITGNSPTAVKIAQPEDAESGQVGFGILFMVDDPLTLYPDPDSQLLGRAQGMWGRSCREDPGFLMSLTYYFMEDIYKGSSVSILGRNLVTDQTRELPVVGGTGLFRMARGYAMGRNYVISNTASIVGYNVTIFHY